MEGFSLDRAWARGVSFISARARDHAIILIGIGVLLTTALQYAIVGGASGMMNPAVMGDFEGISSLGAAFIGAALLTYLLQFGSYFSSWRAGLAHEESLGGAIGWGMLAALLFVVLAIVLLVVSALIMTAAPAVGAIAMVIILLPLAIILYSVFVVMMGLFLLISVLLAALFGASMGANQFFGAAGEGFVAVAVMLAVAILILWLSARLCCTAPAMARHRTFNPFAGIAESWRVTGPGQWRILAYLSLVAIVLGVLMIVVAMIAGFSMMGSMDAGGTPQIGIGMIVGGILLGVAMAYILVTIPAGIYRSAAGEAPVDVFA